MGNKKAKEEKKDGQQAHEDEPFQGDSSANFFEGYKIRNLVSVSNHSMVLTDHDAYAWGNNDKGQLGFGDIRNRSIPTKLVLDTGVPLALDCGCYHTIATTKQGLYAWGYAGCLGQGYSKNEMSPVKSMRDCE